MFTCTNKKEEEKMITENEIVARHKGIRVVQRKNEEWEDFKKRIQELIDKQGDKYLTQT